MSHTKDLLLFFSESISFQGLMVMLSALEENIFYPFFLLVSLDAFLYIMQKRGYRKLRNK
ncbi:hypothetical protein EDC96DRAFT_511100 [Choanephora cucurbitarum]|nr:hypothetical protein EDC96DRAFT_511100 [Choanephora cucurbitarum]